MSVQADVGRNDSLSILPLDEVLEVLRDQNAQLVLDGWNVLDVRWSSTGDLVIFKGFSAVIITPSPKTL